MNYTLNSTKAYHTNRLSTLGWELTVCNALRPDNTILRRLLARNESYGGLLYDFLSQFIPMDGIKRVIEIGGGYGYLMKDFLDRNHELLPLMLDISPYLLGKQKETLSAYDVSYREEDFLETTPVILERFELAIMNENIGDFPTLVGIDRSVLRAAPDDVEPGLRRTAETFLRYGFDLPANERFNLNIGAIEALEKLCASGIPFIFLSEHSCEAGVPASLSQYIRVESQGNPERISLMGHDEYSIKFSHLEKIALAYGYRCTRGPLADFVCFDMTDKIKIALLSGGRLNDDNEIICHFIEDLYKYEYLLLIK
jgi:hypothetical protein